MNVLIADDNLLFRDTLVQMLTQNGGMLVHGVGNGLEAIELLESHPIEIVLLDIQMPKMDGVETARAIIENYPETKVLILSMYKEQKVVLDLMAAGVSGYILKQNCSHTQLIEAIETVKSGNCYYSGETVQELAGALLDTKRPKKSKVKMLSGSELTEREVEVVRLLAQGMTNEEMAKALFISKHTVITHRRNILQKSGVKNTAGLIMYATKNGLLD